MPPSRVDASYRSGGPIGPSAKDSSSSGVAAALVARLPIGQVNNGSPSVPAEQQVRPHPFRSPDMLIRSVSQVSPGQQCDRAVRQADGSMTGLLGRFDVP
jgi:hypothetical protein